MQTNLSDRLRGDAPAFGVTLTIPDPFVAEVLAGADFDFLMIDAEHSPISSYQLQTQLIALRSASAALLVRIPALDPEAIMQVVDLGADGVVVPHVESAAECEVAVRATLYPPEGNRGVGPRRASRIASGGPYMAQANGKTFVAVMIESKGGVDHLDDILATAGLGGVIIGAADLAASLGHLGHPEHEEVSAAIDTIMDRCFAHGVPFGMYAASPAAAEQLRDRGARIITVGSDLLFLEQSMRRVSEGVAPLRLPSDERSPR